MKKIKLFYSFLYATMLMATGFVVFLGGIIGIAALDSLIPAPRGLIPIAFILLFWWLGHFVYKGVRSFQVAIKTAWPNDTPRLIENREMTALCSFLLVVMIFARFMAWSNSATIDHIAIITMLVLSVVSLLYLAWERHSVKWKVETIQKEQEVKQ